MRILKIIWLILFLFSCCPGAYGQRWKEYFDSAKIFNDQKIMEKAIEYCQKAQQELIKDSTGTKSYARVSNTLAILYSDLGKYEQAEPLYIEAKKIREKLLGKDHQDYAAVCNNLAILYSDIGQYEKAIPLYMEAKEIWGKVLGKEHPDYASSCNNLAALYWETGRYEKAEPLYLEAKQVREKVLGKDHPKYAGSCNNLAALYNSMGLYEKSEPLLLEARQVWEKMLGKEHPDYATSCNNLAVLYSLMGQFEKAEPLYLEVSGIREKAFGKEHPDYAQSCDNLGSIYAVMGQNAKAESSYLESKQIWEKLLGKEHPQYASTCDNLAVLYRRMHQFIKAEPLCVEAKQLREKLLGKEHPEYAQSCKNLASLYTEMGRFERAEPLFIEAKQIREKSLGKEHNDFNESCYDLANLYWNLKKPEEAHDLYAEAIELQNFQVKRIFRFTNEAEKQAYIKKIADHENEFLSFSTSVNPHSKQGFSYDVSLTGRNVILSSLQELRNAIYNTTDTIVKNRYDSWMNCREQVAFWHTKQIANRPAYLSDLEERANALEKELTRISSAFKKKQGQNESSWQTIQKDLKPNEAAVEFVEFEYTDGRRWTDSTYYIAFVLRKGKPEPFLVKLFEKKQLDALLRSLENMDTENRINTLYRRNESLYVLIWKPLEKYLDGISKVYFAPAGTLFKISFAALPDSDGHILSNKFQLIQLNTTASAADDQQSFINAADKIQLYGGIRYDADEAELSKVASQYQGGTGNLRSLPEDIARGAGFKFLPGTYLEAEEIKKQAGRADVSVLTGFNAIEESVKALKGKKSPSVLHIATHGFFFPDPKAERGDFLRRKSEIMGKVFRQSHNPLFRSGLIFAGGNNTWHGKPIDGVEDGILTAYEVSNMYLPNTKLVVLSACETALGDIIGSEGVYGLQRAFRMAGVQNLVMSLWKVPDVETTEFMQVFYKNLFSRQTIDKAFYNAQRLMRNKYRDEPYKWAAWVLIR